MTYHQEMKAKYPDRPYVTRPGWELKNMKLALSLCAVLDSDEENQRLADVTRELNLRRKGA